MDRFKSFDWLATVFYPLAVILMEAFWVAPWLSWIGVWPFFSEISPGIKHLASVIIIIVVSFVITRIFTRRNLSLWTIQLIVIGTGFLTMLLVLAVEYADGYVFLSGGWFAHVGQVLGDTFRSPSTIVVAMPAIVYLWWRGIRLGQSTSYYSDIYRSFLIGMAALIALIIFWQISAASGSIPGPGSEIGMNVIAFFFFGLLAIAISHLYSMRNAMPKEEARLTSVWRWLPVMLGVIGGMIIVGFGVASVISPDLISSIGSAANAVLSFLWTVLGYILVPFFYIIQGLMIAFRWFIGLFGKGELPSQETSGNLTPTQVPVAGTAEIPPVVVLVLKWLAVAVIIAVVVFILTKAIARYRDRRAREDIEEIRESLFSWRALRDDLKELFKSMGQRFRQKPPQAPPYRFDEDATGRLDIREIFRHLQWEAGRSGIPRRPHETALEYARRIEHVVPDSSVPLNDLTGMYENVRYGETSPPEEKVDSANSLWQTLKGLLRQLRGA